MRLHWLPRPDFRQRRRPKRMARGEQAVSYGQIAYEAYAAHIASTGMPEPAWEDLSQSVRDAMEAAGQAVAGHVKGSGNA